MTLPARTLTLLVIVSLGLNGIVLLALAFTAGRRKQPAHARPLHLDDALRGVLEGHGRTFQRLEAAIRQLAAQNSELGERFQGAVQRIGLVRYDAFEDVGGQLSFSCALLNEQGDGVVVTSINGRQDTRVYAKQVQQGESIHNLSEEEAAAIREALQGSRQTVEAT